MKDEEKPSLSEMARMLHISRSSFYYQRLRPKKDERLRDEIIAVLNENPAYGYKRIAIHLKLNKKRVLRVMREFGLRSEFYPSGKKKPSKKSHSPDCHPNLAERICPLQPDVVWVGDFTYLWFHGRWFYLATVVDAFSREVLSWRLGTNHTRVLVMDALEDAVKDRGSPPGMFHSDHGSEYTSEDCETYLRKFNVAISHAQKGKPWKNGKQESFYGKFKKELGNIHRFQTIDQLFEAISNLVHYYNHKRIHSALKMPPREYYLKTRRHQETTLLTYSYGIE